MGDQRPRHARPRKRGGRGRLSDVAAVQRHQQSVHDLQQVLQPEAEALRETAAREEVVRTIRERATDLAQLRPDADVEVVVEATLDEIFGLGPLEPLLRDPDLRRIEVDGAAVCVDGEPVLVGFRDEAHARSVFDRILRSVGEDLDASPAGVSASMMDGSVVRARLEQGRLVARIERPR